MLELKLEKYARILLYAAPFLVLIFVESFYFPFVITRTVFFRLIIQLGLSLYLLLLALDFKKYRPRFSLGLALAGAYMSVELAAALFGLDFYKSFWSDFERMEGVVSLIYLTFYLFLLQVFLREKKQWLHYIRLILISGALVSLYGLAQKFNLFPVFEAGIGRVTSTIGNAAFLAGYMLLAFALAAYYWFNETDKNFRYFALAAGALNLLVLFLTSTRGAIFGFIGGGVVFLLLGAIYLPGKFRRYSLASLVVLGALIAGFVAFRGRLADSKIEFIGRLATISAEDGSVLNRLKVWRMAMSDFKYHPALGVGMENFDIIYNKYYTPDISENWFDRTHNVYLDQLMAGGVIGLAAYLGIFIYLFYALFKKRREDYWQFAIFSSLLIAYGLHNFFVFDTINTSFLYFFLIGLIGFKGTAGEAEKAEPDNRAFNYAFITLILINIFAFYKLVYLPVKINRALYAGYYYVVADTFRSYENFKEALSYKFGSVEAAVQLNKSYDIIEAQNNVNAGIKEKYLSLNREKLEFASANFPLDIQTKMYLGQLILNNYSGEAELDQAEKLFEESIKLSPTRVEPYYLLYNLYAKRGMKDQARAVLAGLAEKLPWYGGVKIMLMSDLAKDDPGRAEELYQQAIKQANYADFRGLVKIISYLIDQKRYGETIPYYERLFGSEPDRYDFRVDLAKVYYLTNRFDAAVEQINIVNEKSPETLKNYGDFVNLLYNAYNKN